MRGSPTLSALLMAVLVGSCGAGEASDDAADPAATSPYFPIATQSAEARQLMIDGVHEDDVARNEEAYELYKRAIAADPKLLIAHLQHQLDANTIDNSRTLDSDSSVATRVTTQFATLLQAFFAFMVSL